LKKYLGYYLDESINSHHHFTIVHKIGQLLCGWKVRESGHLFARVDDGRAHYGGNSILIQLGLISPQSTCVVGLLINHNFEALLKTLLGGSHAGGTCTNYSNSLRHCGTF